MARLLKMAAALPSISVIASLRGPVVSGDNIAEALRLYDLWSSYTPEIPDGVLVAYASIYGNTAKVALETARRLQERGFEVATIDLCRQDVSHAVAEAFRMGTIVAASSTYDATMFPAMHDFLHHLQLKNLCGRNFALIENGSWAPAAAKAMADMVATMKDCPVLPEKLTVRSSAASVTEADYNRFMTNFAKE